MIVTAETVIVAHAAHVTSVAPVPTTCGGRSGVKVAGRFIVKGAAVRWDLSRAIQVQSADT